MVFMLIGWSLCYLLLIIVKVNLCYLLLMASCLYVSIYRHIVSKYLLSHYSLLQAVSSSLAM